MALRRTKDLHEFTIAATDADIGRIHDLYFDDRSWMIRYIVVQMGELLDGQKVLISLKNLKQPVWMPLHVRVLGNPASCLTRADRENTVVLVKDGVSLGKDYLSSAQYGNDFQSSVARHFVARL
jgi:hypothetical protein